MNVFEMLDIAINKLARKNQQYGDIGKEITEDNKKKAAGLNAEECEWYDMLAANDRNRLLGIFENKHPHYKEENRNWNGVNIDAPQQVL